MAIEVQVWLKDDQDQFVWAEVDILATDNQQLAAALRKAADALECYPDAKLHTQW